MLRWVLLMGPLLFGCSRSDGSCTSPPWTECISRDLAWCEALGQVVTQSDADVPDGGNSCQPPGYRHPLVIPDDAGVLEGCPSPSQMTYWIRDGFITDAGTITDGQCCYPVENPCA